MWRSKVVPVVLTILAASIASTHALLVCTSPTGRLNEASVVVAGTLQDLSVRTQDEVDYTTGVIHVIAVFRGDVAPGDTLRVQWTNSTHLSCPRKGASHALDTLALWMLDPPNGTTFIGGYHCDAIVLDPQSKSTQGLRTALQEASSRNELAEHSLLVKEFVDGLF